MSKADKRQRDHILFKCSSELSKEIEPLLFYVSSDVQNCHFQLVCLSCCWQVDQGDWVVHSNLACLDDVLKMIWSLWCCIIICIQHLFSLSLMSSWLALTWHAPFYSFYLKDCPSGFIEFAIHSWQDLFLPPCSHWFLSVECVSVCAAESWGFRYRHLWVSFGVGEGRRTYGAHLLWIRYTVWTIRPDACHRLLLQATGTVTHTPALD